MQLSRPVAGDVARRALGEGVIVNAIGDRTLRLVPPLIITNDELDEALLRLERALTAVPVEVPA